MDAEMLPSLGIYISVPFCRAKCSFCNFASGVGSPEAQQEYVDRLCSEIRQARAAAARCGAELPLAADTVYLGGGTPSLLTPEQIRSVFHALQQEFVLVNGVEITMEAAPGQVDGRMLEAALRAGVNRVSLGVQSFIDAEARAVGRTHDFSLCLGEFTRLRREGVANLGADLIAGLPYQTAASWQQSLEIAAAAELEHLSVYMFEIDEDSRLGREVLGGGARLHAPAVASEDAVAAFYDEACRLLPAAGYSQYEISNFARPGYCSRHNVKYWTRAPYLGFGLDAHSMLQREDGAGALRWANPDRLPEYTGACIPAKPELVNGRAAFEETVFLGLRLTEGLPWGALAPWGASWCAELRRAALPLVEEGLLGSNDGRLWLTSRGRLVSSEIFGELLAGVPA